MTVLLVGLFLLIVLLVAVVLALFLHSWWWPSAPERGRLNGGRGR